jgi:hypothetical protein
MSDNMDYRLPAPSPIWSFTRPLLVFGLSYVWFLLATKSFLAWFYLVSISPYLVKSSDFRYLLHGIISCVSGMECPCIFFVCVLHRVLRILPQIVKIGQPLKAHPYHCIFPLFNGALPLVPSRSEHRRTMTLTKYVDSEARPWKEAKCPFYKAMVQIHNLVLRI